MFLEGLFIGIMVGAIFSFIIFSFISVSKDKNNKR